MRKKVFLFFIVCINLITPFSLMSITTPAFNPFIEKALELAAQWHDNTYRKGRWRKPPFSLKNNKVKVPVIVHLASVAFILQRAGWDDEVVSAGLLHDILEDQNREKKRYNYEQLKSYMTERIAQLVQEVSEQKNGPDGKELDWKTRKNQYLAHLHVCSNEAMAISLADKIHNLWTMNQTLKRGIDIFTSTQERKAIKAGPKKQHWYFMQVLKAAGKHKDPRLLPLQKRLYELLQEFSQLTKKKS